MIIKRTMMFAAFLMLAGASALGFSGRTGAQEASSGQVAAAARGARAWADNCGSCHNIRSPGEFSVAQWAVAVAHMRVRANIPGSTADDIKAFLAASNDQGAAVAAPPSAVAGAVASTPGDSARGALIYGETCVACHGANGRGALEGVPDLTARGGRLSKPDTVLLRNMIDGFQSPGSPMPMPPRGGNPDLADEDMADVLAYLRQTFQHHDDP
jgi:mono/diheme cytochrome c family protein